MKFHSLKMEEINKIVKEYWINTYKGNGTKVSTVMHCALSWPFFEARN